MSVTDLCASVGSTLDRIDQALGELVPTSPAALRMALCGRQADELAVVVGRLAGEERAAGGRGRTLSALDMLGQALGRRTARGSDRICVDSGVPIDRVRTVLLELEAAGLAQRHEWGWVQCGLTGAEVRS